MTKLLKSLTLAAIAVALTPNAALAEREVRIKASFTVAFTRTLNTTNATYCGQAILPAAVAANGAGYSSLGALSFELEKTLAAPGDMQGCVTLKSPKGDSLFANYSGMIAGPNGQGTLTFIGGTGRFLGATGSAKFTGYFVGFYPTLTIFGGGTMPAIQGTAFYVVDGTLQLGKETDNE